MSITIERVISLKSAPMYDVFSAGRWIGRVEQRGEVLKVVHPDSLGDPFKHVSESALKRLITQEQSL